MSRRVLVLPSPPTANGDLHLGHLAGPYLAADVFARYRRMRGQDVAYVTGADVHQSYVLGMAERNGATPEATADAFAGRIEDSLDAAGIEVNAFVLPHRSPDYQQFVGEFFKQLASDGHLVDEERPVLWCPSCSRHLLGAAVRGSCGNCGRWSDGALCESCGRPVDPAGLRDSCCVRCGGAAELRPMRRLFFALEAFADQLRDYHTDLRMRPRSKQIVEDLLAGELFDAAISSPGEWGIPVPVAGFDGQRLDVWAEVGPGYAASTQAMTKGRGEPEGWRDYWCSDDAEIIQFFGFDNTVPHTLLYPALYFAHGGLRPPDRFVINEFHNLDGEKFSTSRRHAVWGGDILARVSADGLRYYLCLTAPEDEQGNFTLADFKETVNLDLATTIGPLVEDMLRAAGSDLASSTRDDGADIVAELSDRAHELGRFLEPDTFTLRGAAHVWRDMALALGERFRPSQRASGDGRPQLAGRSLVESLSLLAVCANPLMPEFATRLWRALGAGDDLGTHPWGEPVHRLDGSVTPLTEGSLFPEVRGAHLPSLIGGMATT